MYYLRQVCWDRIFIPGNFDLSSLSALERSQADLAAGEAWHAQRHLEMVDFMSYFSLEPPADDAPLHKRIEYAQNLFDFLNRSRGGAFSNRVSIHPKTVYFVAARPVNISGHLEQFRSDHKAALADVMAELEGAYRACIKEMDNVF
jgi:hypothetical protein